MKNHLRCLFTLASILLCSIWALGQDTASITGTVTDTTGAAVANAEVVVSNPDRGINRSTTTNSSGDYLVAGLPVGTVNVSVAVTGFKKYAATGIVRRVGEKARHDLTLQVGASSSEITVQGEDVAQVETQSAELSGTITGKEISQLQLNGRNFTQLVTLVPGVSNQSGQDDAGVGVGGNVSFSINGGRTEYNNWELDGGDNMDNGSNTTLNVYPSLDAIAEFKVLTSNYGAQYGRSGSGTVEVETKSGTNKFHGDAYEFVRNDAFNAITFPQSSVPPYKKNDFGYTIGGPVFIPGVYNKDKQKTFFFWSQEWRRERVPANLGTVTVPSLAERAGDFNDVCPGPDCPSDPAFFPAHVPFASNMVPIDQANAPGLMAQIPVPTDGGHLWNSSPTLPTTWREELFRVDQNIGSKLRATFRYIHDSWDQTYPTPLWSGGTSFPTIQTNFGGPGVSMVARLTATASPTLLNEFVASYTTDHITLIPIGPWQRPQSMTAGELYPGVNQGKVPGISLSGSGDNAFNFGEDVGYLPNGPYNSNPTYTYRDNVTKIVGKHNLQFGAYFVAAQKNELSAPGVATNGVLSFNSDNAGVSTGNAFADLLIGNIASFSQTSAQPKFYNRYKIFEPYFQDDWRVTSHLTVNLGLRVSMFGTYRDRYHNEFNFDPDRFVAGDSSVDPETNLVIGNAFNGVVQCGVTQGVPDSCMKGHLFNPAPRIGFAWDPTGSGKTAIRGGYGVFFEHTNGNEATAESLEPAASPAVQTTSVSNVFGYANITPQPAGATSPLAMLSIPNKAVWPYVQQWHFDIQREVLKNTVATVSYVGSKGTHLTRFFDINQIKAVPLSQNPYAAGEPITDADCQNPGLLFDDFGVPTNAVVTDSGAPIAYNAPTTPGGMPSGPAVNFGIACGLVSSADALRTQFPGVGSVSRLEENGSSSYNALEVSLRRSYGGLEINGSYTYSHSIDNASSARDAIIRDTFDQTALRASSNFDQRHLFNIGYVYDLPFFKAAGLSHTLLGGWQWSGIATIESGTPFSLINGVVGDSAGVANGVSSGSGQSYADLIGDPKVGIQNTPLSQFGPAFYNVAAFAAPRGLTFGNAPRNLLTNPRRTNFDMSLFKHFAFGDKLNVEFRAEAFNVFNHTEYAWLGGDGGSAASNSPFSSTNNTATCYSADADCLSNGTLRPASAHNARILQLGAKIIF